MARKPTEAPEGRFHGNNVETAELLGISTQALWKAVKERGCPVERAGGKREESVFDWRKVLAWRLADLQRQNAREAEQARLNKAQADRTELELRVRRGELIDRERMEKAMASVLLTVRDGILAIPQRNASEFAAMTDEVEVRERLDKELRAALQALVVNLGSDVPRKRRKR